MNTNISIYIYIHTLGWVLKTLFVLLNPSRISLLTCLFIFLIPNLNLTFNTSFYNFDSNTLNLKILNYIFDSNTLHLKPKLYILFEHSQLYNPKSITVYLNSSMASILVISFAMIHRNLHEVYFL